MSTQLERMKKNKILAYYDLTKRMIARNSYGLDGKSSKNKVNVEYFPIDNIGDSLTPIIVEWLLRKKNIDPDKTTDSTKHLIGVGSILNFGLFDATVWGSGVLSSEVYKNLRSKRKICGRKLDIRAVRGPLSRKTLLLAGYMNCPKVYGDPAILMPYIYNSNSKKKYNVSVILHHETNLAYDNEDNIGKKMFDESTVTQYGIHFIDPKTLDYRFFIDEIVASNLVISSSLHGIILAESYGVPAVFLNWKMEKQNDKFVDWYLSTGREMHYSIDIISALNQTVPGLPDLANLRKGLLDSFPYDLWE